MNDITTTEVNLPLVRRVVRDFLVKPIVQRLQRKKVNFGGRNWRRLFTKDCELGYAARVLPQLKITQDIPATETTGASINVLPVGLETQRWLDSLSPEDRLIEYSRAMRDLLRSYSTKVVSPEQVEQFAQELDTSTRSAPPLLGL